ncbi:hypothetical protein L9F63_012959, partial [Diploptera punctata]
AEVLERSSVDDDLEHDLTNDPRENNGMPAGTHAAGGHVGDGRFLVVDHGGPAGNIGRHNFAESLEVLITRRECSGLQIRMANTTHRAPEGENRRGYLEIEGSELGTHLSHRSAQHEPQENPRTTLLCEVNPAGQVTLYIIVDEIQLQVCGTVTVSHI